MWKTKSLLDLSVIIYSTLTWWRFILQSKLPILKLPQSLMHILMHVSTQITKLNPPNEFCSKTKCPQIKGIHGITKGT